MGGVIIINVTTIIIIIDSNMTAPIECFVKCQEPYAIVGCNQSTCIHSTNSTHLHPFHKFDPLYLLYKLNQSICLLLYPFYKFRERDCWFTPTICLLSVTSLIHQSCP
jgi:hypothetical protein